MPEIINRFTHRAVLREAKLKEQLAQLQSDFAARLQQRDDDLHQRLVDLEAEVRLLKQRLYGKSCEGHHHPNSLTDTPATDADNPATLNTPPSAPRRRRGQQRGRPSHGRRRYEHLPVAHQTIDLPPEECHCTNCGLPFTPCGSEPHPTTLVEVEVRCPSPRPSPPPLPPGLACAALTPTSSLRPPVPRLIPNSALGVSVWVWVLLDKYAFHRPTYRLLAQLRTHDLDLALGTLTDGLQRLLPLLEPVYEALRTHNQQQHHWHGDETRWQVFATVEGKVGYLWYLWLVLSAEAAVFVMAQGRSHNVPEEALGENAHGIFNVDRYSAYPAMKQVKEGQITLALCWAHLRRDFIEAERSRPELRYWASAWLTRISNVYRLNEARLKVWQRDELGFATADQAVRTAVVQMEHAGTEEQEQANLPLVCRKVLQSMSVYWTGLTVFVEHPEVPMDNNAAERAERGPVVGRKNYYGSGAVWAGKLAAVIFSVLATLRLWGLNAQPWLTSYLTACAEHGGQAVPELRRWLPWSMTEAERTEVEVSRASRAEDAEQDSS